MNPTPRTRVPVLYIGGSGRSGSTLLDRILGQIPGVVSIGEAVHLWRRGVLDDQLCGCELPFRSCPFWREVGRLAFGGWDSLDPAEILSWQRAVDRNRYVPAMLFPTLFPGFRPRLERYAAVLGVLYTSILEASGARVVVDSSKHASTAFLLRRVPAVELRVIHLVRDPRGVSYSWTKAVRKPEVKDREEYMPRYHPFRMSMRWNAYNAMFHLLRWTGTPSMRVRYESLIEDPGEELRRILAFAGIPGGDLPFLRGRSVNLGLTHSVAGNPMRFRRGAIELTVDREWQDRMSPLHRRIVTCATWPMNRLYGYGRRGGVT